MSDTNEVRVGGIWYCKIGEHSPLQRGADSPMRDAVAAEYKKLTGQEPAFIFSGWSGELTEPERAVVENRLPVREATPPADVALADDLAGIAEYLDHHGPQRFVPYLRKASAALRARAVPDAGALLDEYERQTDALPIQHEEPTRGCCTYNWRMAVIRDLRAMLAASKEAK